MFRYYESILFSFASTTPVPVSESKQVCKQRMNE